MKKLQQFVEKKKMDHKFKQAGAGHKLDEPRKMPAGKSSQAEQVRVTPAASAQRAGEAALSRLQPDKQTDSASMRAIKAQALAEREAERSAEQIDKLSLSSQLLPDNPLDAMAKLIHTINKEKDKRLAGIEVICKYIDNVCAHPTEEKYGKIRMGNKAFQEKVACLVGAEDFLQAVGFIPKMLLHQDTEEPFLQLPPTEELDQLRAAVELLRTTEPIKAILHRNLKVYQPSTNAGQFQLPQDFYRLTGEDIRREQQLKSEEVEHNAQLRTKAMKEAEAQRNLRRYRYALLRVRFPDGIIIQGTFYANDKLSVLLEFIRSILDNDWQPFILTDASNKKLVEENCSLAELKLAPAAMVYFSWDAAIMAEITAAQGSSQRAEYLKPEVISMIEVL